MYIKTPLLKLFHYLIISIKMLLTIITTPDGSIPQNYPGWELHRISGYVYPAD